eukprot:TRINITY_DN36661_c0_g1_i1.p1 TRINITY_DN36661_c0_g1~~TRINITY_DN36661_c0_g1_i1.p1  ORF type:complete len:121 (-),score=27.12 TRINITY_DN36661_c0_g1_i1:364-726(-)
MAAPRALGEQLLQLLAENEESARHLRSLGDQASLVEEHLRQLEVQGLDMERAQAEAAFMSIAAEDRVTAQQADSKYLLAARSGGSGRCASPDDAGLAPRWTTRRCAGARSRSACCRSFES